MTNRVPTEVIAARDVELVERHLVDAYPDAGIRRTDPEIGLSLQRFKYAIERLRGVWAEHEINIVCAPIASHEPWEYRFAGSLDIDDPDGAAAAFWFANRVGDAETRLQTIHDVVGSMVSGVDRRTVAGRKAVRIHQIVGHLLTELEHIADA